MTDRVGNCGLCRRATAALQDSHALPAWCYRRIRGDPAVGNPNPFQVADETAVQTSRQLKQFFLCNDCEQRFGLHEDYVARISSQRDGSQPMLDHITSPLASLDEVVSVRAHDLNWEQLYQFGLSVTWRADVMLGAVDLGDEYREAARLYLSGSAAHPEGIHVVLLVHLQEPGRARLDRTFTVPGGHRLRACRVHRFLLCGLEFWTLVGKRQPSDLVDMCLLCAPEKWVALLPAWKSPTVEGVLGTVARAKRAKRR